MVDRLEGLPLAINHVASYIGHEGGLFDNNPVIALLSVLATIELNGSTQSIEMSMKKAFVTIIQPPDYHSSENR